MTDSILNKWPSECSYKKGLTGVLTIRVRNISKCLLQIFIIGMLLAAFLPVTPASAVAPTAIYVTISESFSKEYTYEPVDQVTDGVAAALDTDGDGTITIHNNAGIVLSDVDLTLSIGHTNTWVQQVGDTIPAEVSAAAGGVRHVVIRSFPVNGNVHIDYHVDTTYVPPVTLDTVYNVNYVTNSVDDAGAEVTLTANLNTAGLPSDVTSITPEVTIVSADNVTQGAVGTADWSLVADALPGPIANWIVDPGHWDPVLTKTTAESADSVITAKPNDVGALVDWNTAYSLLPLATSTATYSVTSNEASCSGIGLTAATATTSLVSSKLTKEYVSPNWKFTPEVSVTGTLTYHLSSVTEWTVSNTDLNTHLGDPAPAPAIDNSQKDLTPDVDVTTASPWIGTDAANQLLFPYNGIPVGFMKPTITVKDTDSQFHVLENGAVSSTGPDGVTLVKKIFVLNGYKVEATKTITPGADPGDYSIGITVKNLGTWETPPHVVVYDIVPTLFYSTVAGSESPTNIVTVPVGAAATQQDTPVTDGEAFYWDIGTLAKNDHAAGGDDEATITYDVSGTGLYTASDLYVVGIDPAQSMNVQTTPSLANMSTMVNMNYEPLAAISMLGLVVIGMVGTVRRRFQ